MTKLASESGSASRGRRGAALEAVEQRLSTTIGELRKQAETAEPIARHLARTPGRVGARVRRRRQQVERAEADLVEASRWLVVEIARRYRRMGLEVEDLLQEGSIGLMRAVDKFEPRRGYRFSTYANWWIRQAMGRAIANQGHTVRVPIHMRHRIRRLVAAAQRHAQRHGRSVAIGELAAQQGLDPKTVEAAFDVIQPPLSLEMPVGQHAKTDPLHEIIANPKAADPEAQAIEADLADAVRAALRGLPPREALILRKHFGIDEKRPYTFAQIASSLDLTRERVRQIEARALDKLRLAPRGERLRHFARR